MLVEDESIIARDIMDSLEALGYEVIGVEVTGQNAIDRAGRDRPSLILMDIMLQDSMDGIETASLILGRYDIPVIYLTAYADERILERAKLTEPFGYLIKPFDEKELYFTIEMALYKHEMQRRLKNTMQQYQALLETSGAVAWEVDLSTLKFTYIGPRIADILGYPQEAWTDFDFWASHIHPDDKEWAVKFCQTETALSKDHAFEYRMTAKNNGIVWIRDIVTVVKEGDRPVRLRGFLLDITERKQAEEEREKLINELRDALNNIKTLRGLLPICAWCKKVRNDKGYWEQVETYVQEHSDAEFTHGMCPDCQESLNKELEGYDNKK